jgi:hypothetical protein
MAPEIAPGPFHEPAEGEDGLGLFDGSACSSVVEAVLVPAMGRPVLFSECLEPLGNARARLFHGCGHSGPPGIGRLLKS